LRPGDLFELGPRQFVVVGVMKSAGSTFGSEVWAKRSLVGPLFGKESFTSLVLRARDDSSEGAKALSQDLMTNFKKAALQAKPETEYFNSLSATNQQFLVAIIFVTVVMAIGGVFGVMNTMFAAVAQRSKDIGVLRILGFTRWQILTSFFVESLLVALVGGTIGCALGYLADGWTATSIVSGGMGGGGKFVVLKLVVDANTLAMGILLTLLMGALGGLLPALSAMRLRPLESLR
jgi:ABC-type antimicrobial peptide transport system permease subunit